MAGKQAVYDVFVRFRINSANWSKSLNKVTSQLDKASKKMTQFGSSMTKQFTLPLGLASAAAVKLGLDVEESFAKIQNLVGISSDRIQDFQRNVASLSGITGKSQKELADALFVVTSAGARGAESLQILSSAAKASAVGLGDTKEIARTVTAVMQAYGKENLSASHATDILYNTVREGNLEAEDLSGTMGKLFGLASKMGISFAELGANVATFTRLGVSADEATTSLQAIMATFLNPTSEARDALAQFGLTAQDVRDKISKNGLADTLIELIRVTEGNDEAISTIVPNIRALRGVLGTAGVQAESYKNILASVANTTGSVDAGFKNVSKTASFQFKQALVDLQNVGIQIGNILIPMLSKVVGFFAGILKKFASLPESTKKMAVGIGILIAAIGPLVFIGGKIVAVISSIIKVFRILIIVNGVLLLKILAIVGAVAALVLIGTAIYKNWDNIGKFFSNLWDEIKLAFLNGMLNIKKAWAKFLEFFNLDSTGATEGVNELQEKVDELHDTIQSRAPLSEQFVDVLSSTWDELKNTVNQAADSVKKFVNISDGLGGSSLSPVADEATVTKTGAPSTLSRTGFGVTTGDALIKKVGKIKTAFVQLKEKSQEMSQVAQQAFKDLAVSVGESIGEIIAGTGNIEGFLNKILSAVVGFAKQFGEVLIAIGVAKVALEKIGISGVGAIIAGTALVALATVASKLLSKGPEVPGYEVGTNYVPRDGLAYLHKGEAVVPKKYNTDNYGGRSQVILLDSVVSYDKLRLVLKNGENKKLKTHGA